MRFRGLFLSRTLASRLCTVGLVVLLLLTVPACDSSSSDEGPSGPGEPEVITRVVVRLADQAGGNTASAAATDPDGDGRGFPEGRPTLRIVQGVTYNGAVEVFGPDDEELTEEILDESSSHQFFFTLQDGFSNDYAELLITDTDANGQPLGQRFQLTITLEEAGMGVLNVVLRHYADGPKPGTATGGEIDVEVNFPIEVVLQ